jgi:flagellar hook-associated protein 2
MSLSTNLISGLSSGFDWRSVIDQLMKIEHRPVDLVGKKKTEYEQKLKILQSLNTSLLGFKSKADELAKNNSLNYLITSVSTTSAQYGSSDFFTVKTSTDASPGSYTITMNDNSSVAQARKISSKSFTSYDTDLGLSGEFVINGRALKVEATDDLKDIAAKINNLNSGAGSTGVTASVLTVSSGDYRMILSSDNTGKDALTICDAGSDAQSILATGLGFTDGTTSIKNLISNGAQSEEFSSSSVSVGSLLGIKTAQSGTVTFGAVGNPNRFSLAVDLSGSITEIAANINKAASDVGSNITASVVSSTEDGVTTYRLKVLNTTSFTDHNHVLETLGILEGGQADVAEVHRSAAANTLTTAAGGGNATADGAWGQINTGGDANDIANGDTITFTGVNHIGTRVTGTYTITDKNTDTIQGLLTAVQNAFSAVDGGGYAVTAVIEDGKIKITDNASGDSLLKLSVTAHNEGGGSLDLGTITASMQGYSMQIQQGQDASIVIDGTAITSSSNVLNNVISGVTINLLAVESGTTVKMTVSRDYNSILSSVQELLDSYNQVLKVINEQIYYNQETKSAGFLQGDSTLLSIKSQMVEILTTTITGLPSTLSSLSMIGIHSQINYSDHSVDGKLTLDGDTFKNAFNDNFLGLKRIFIAEGSTTDADVEYVSHGNKTVAGTYEVNITQAATQAGVAGTEVLTSGIGAANVEVLSINQDGKIAAVILNGASGENGSSIDNIVNALNSELDSQYTQIIMGNVKNTNDMGETTAITNNTVWSALYSGGVAAGLSDGQVISFSGHRKNGTEVTGSYTIKEADVDTIQGFLSAIESAYNNEVSASINRNGYLVIADGKTGASKLDINITTPGNLNFGAVTTSNLVGSQRSTKNAGADAITETDTWNDLDGQTLSGGETIRFAGFKSNGEAVLGSYTVNTGDQLGVFLSAVETAYGGSVNAAFQDGRLVLTDGSDNSTLGIMLFEPEGGGVDFGTLSGGVTGRHSIDVTASKDGSDHLVLTHDDFGNAAFFSLSQGGAELGLGAVAAGLDVAGTINGEAATGAGRILTGSAPVAGQTTSVEGLIVKYTGTSTGSQGNVKITMGVGELFSRVLYDITNTIDGYLNYRMKSMAGRIDDFKDRIAQMEDRLNLKMESMVSRFVAMEKALARIQSMSSWLSGQINAATNAWR